MRSREDLVVKIQEALKHPKADLLFEIGLGEPTPTKAAQRAHREWLSNEEEKLAKWIAVFRRDHGKGWFGALHEILENSETENSEVGLTKTQKKVLDSIKPGNFQEAIDLFMNRSTGHELVTLKPAFDPKGIKTKTAHLERLALNSGLVLVDGPMTKVVEPGLLFSLGMTFEEVINYIPDPEPGHENYLLVVNCLPLTKLMKFVVVDGKRGDCLLNENEIEDAVEVPKTLFYWRYDVENGKATCGKKPVDAEKSFKEMKRQGLTAREVICRVMADPSVLKNRGIWAVSSRHGDAGVANLWLIGGKPKLNWGWAYDSLAKWGSASCGSD